MMTTIDDKLVHIVGVEVVDKHRLRLTFEDGVAGELEFTKREWRGVLAPLRDPDFFAKVTVDPQLGTLAWPGGLDIAPEPLYKDVVRRYRPQTATV